jgi:hypothetical protein
VFSSQIREKRVKAEPCQVLTKSLESKQVRGMSALVIRGCQERERDPSGALQNTEQFNFVEEVNAGREST